jgi:DNA-binding CsgD family transcriptional regulator
MNRQLTILHISLFLLLLTPLHPVAKVKVIGTPAVKNYDNPMVQAGTQTWMIDLSASGLAYFANNDGVLEFDGLKWRIYPLPEKTVVRSVKATSDGRIYAGGYNEFGFFKADPHGQLQFHPLHHLLPDKYEDFDEVWRIFEMNGHIIFQTFTQIMIYRNETIKVIEAPEMFHFSFVVNDVFYVNDRMNGLFRLSDDELIPLSGTENLTGELIWTMLPKNNDLLIATAEDGIFIYDGKGLTEWKNEAAELLKQNQLFCGYAVDEDTYAFGTIQNGLIICSTEGVIYQHLNIEMGLQNNTVLSIKTDQHANLWLGLDNGIDYVEINSPLTYLSTYNNLSSGYAAVIHEGMLYLGTNRGVFYHAWEELKQGSSEQKFTLVPGTQGQVWSLEVIEGSLFCGHNSGIFLIEGTKSEMLSDIQGGWTFVQPRGQKDIVICGTYTFLVKLERVNGKWQQGVRIEGFKESSSYMVNDGEQSLWISHGYKGVFRPLFNETYDSVVKVDFYDSNHGFPSDKNIIVFEISGRPVFTTGQGIYRYDAQSDSFVPDALLSARLTRTDMNILREDEKGNIWYFTDTELGVFRLKEDGNYNEVVIPFKELKQKFIKWFQFVYPYNDNNVLIGTQNGFAHYTSIYFKNYKQPFSAFIRNVQILSRIDSVIYRGSPSDGQFSADIPYRFNHLQFEFAANDFENPDQLRFLTKLKGFDKDWVEWKNSTSRQFTNLRHGNYTFEVKAINVFGHESNPAEFTFHILPPWYLSMYAYFGYAVLFLLLIFMIAKYIRYRIERSKKAFEAEQQKHFEEREKQLQIESLLAEQEVSKLRNEKLQTEKIQKDKELANITMQIIQRSKSLSAIKRDLRKLVREMGDHPAINQINMINKRINRSIDTDKQWEVFESHFENVHEEFLKRLKEKYPDLTPREMKLCAYLRLNISSKEIANLMNISTRGVEISRYRLRKKLNLEHDINLTEFIMGF